MIFQLVFYELKEENPTQIEMGLTNYLKKHHGFKHLQLISYFVPIPSKCTSG